VGLGVHEIDRLRHLSERIGDQRRPVQRVVLGAATDAACVMPTADAQPCSSMSWRRMSAMRRKLPPISPSWMSE
jgi:hypothetical protein